jgi:hypothetical protein
MVAQNENRLVESYWMTVLSLGFAKIFAKKSLLSHSDPSPARQPRPRRNPLKKSLVPSSLLLQNAAENKTFPVGSIGELIA